MYVKLRVFKEVFDFRGGYMPQALRFKVNLRYVCLKKCLI